MCLARAEGFRAPQGCVPWDELFLGLTQAAALSCWGLQEGNAASCLRHWGQGEPWGLRVATPWVHSPSGVAPHCPPPIGHPGAMGTTKSQQVLGAFAKPVRGKIMKLERFQCPLPLEPSPYHWPNPLSGSLPRTWNADPQGMLDMANPVRTMRSPMARINRE